LRGSIGAPFVFVHLYFPDAAARLFGLSLVVLPYDTAMALKCEIAKQKSPFLI